MMYNTFILCCNAMLKYKPIPAQEASTTGLLYIMRQKHKPCTQKTFHTQTQSKGALLVIISIQHLSIVGKNMQTACYGVPYLSGHSSSLNSNPAIFICSNYPEKASLLFLWSWSTETVQVNEPTTWRTSSIWRSRKKRFARMYVECSPVYRSWPDRLCVGNEVDRGRAV